MNRKTPIGRVVLSSQDPMNQDHFDFVWPSYILRTPHAGASPGYGSPVHWSGQTTTVKLLINPLKLNMEHNCLDFDPYRDPYQFVFHGSFWS